MGRTPGVRALSVLPLVLTLVVYLAAMMLTSPPLTAAGSGPQCRGLHWVRAWTVPASEPLDPGRSWLVPAGPLRSAPAGSAPAGSDTATAGQVLRTDLRPLLGGDTFRVRLSNRFGTTPLVLRAVRVGVLRPGAAPVSPRPVVFGDEPSVTLLPGAEVLSDPVELGFAAFETLSVNGYLQRVPRTLSHSLVVGVDVLAPRRVGAVVAFGDSITDGWSEMLPVAESAQRGDRGVRYPEFLARRLAAQPGAQRMAVLNTGISGNLLLRDGRLGPSGLSRLDADVLAHPGVTDVIVLEGINDLGQPPRSTTAEVIVGLRRVVERLQAAGLNVVVGTLTPTGGSMLPGYGDRVADRRREVVNKWIRASGVPDGVADFDAALRDPRDPSRLRPRFDSGDHLHPSTAGYRAMAGAVAPALLRGPDCRVPG
ncbi:MAG: SGNH/GDSL hydrolase family protein [Pseudonocardiaceae bacterium]